MGKQPTTMLDESSAEDEEEILLLAQAYRKAQDEDVIEANNMIASATNSWDVEGFQHYVVSLAWFRKAWGALTGVHGKENVPQIHNNILLAGPKAMDPKLRHGVDYILVGQRTWLLMQQKFGYDIEIPVRCIFHVKESSRLSFSVPTNERRVEFRNGRFPYEKFVQSEAVVSDEATEPEGEEEDDLSDTDSPLVYNNNNSKNKNYVVLLPATKPPPPTRRQFGSGLGNLGNTCFMNSTLQCLAHTEPLQRYFLSGAYKNDLNRDNPLGTRGELATQFAKLLADMWIGTTEHHVVYPREFKYTLGKHAEQFVGYDQHDSQELATYLLDALHEDCNRVTHKPYVEKPEQAPDESDKDAAIKAWNLHLQRDDSQVIENFMGLVKSRLECPKCSRISTTFDPFMYLSVPIPGSDTRSMDVLFVPLHPMQRAQSYHVKVPKLGCIGDVIKAVFKARIERGYSAPSMENVMTGELFSKVVWKWFETTSPLDSVGEKDEIIIFELKDINEIRKMFEANNPPEEPIELPTIPKSATVHNEFTLSQIFNQGTDTWMTRFQRYLRNFLAFEHLWSWRKNVPLEERVAFFIHLVDFIKECQNPEGKRPRDETEEWNQTDSDDDVPSPTIEQACSRSSYFKDVKTKRDISVLELIAERMRRGLEKEIEESKPCNPNGVFLEIRLIKDFKTWTPPFCVRVPGSMTVYELRELIAYRLHRSLIRNRISTGEPTSERQQNSNIICNIPMRWNKRPDLYSTCNNSTTCGWMPLGSLRVNWEQDGADPDNSEEKETMDEFFEDHGLVSLEWPSKSADEMFDTEEYAKVDFFGKPPHSEDAKVDRVSVLDCIDKFCQREQLEETEQWYCSRCKDHVCAWKQFDIFRSPPHLIVHLKRFQFSANSHRRQKISRFVDFPLKELDLRNHVLHWQVDDQPIYDCYAVSNHFGGLGGGHYTAFALNGDIWCNYDDSRITTNVDPKDVVSESAYVLYYRRRDVPVGADFEIDLQTPDDALPPVIIADSRTAWDEPPSPNATMVDADEDTNDNLRGPLSRSTSPASVSAMNGDYDEATSDAYNNIDDDIEENNPLRQ